MDAWIHFQIRRGDMPHEQRPAFERDFYLQVGDIAVLRADLERGGANMVSQSTSRFVTKV